MVEGMKYRPTEKGTLMQGTREDYFIIPVKAQLGIA
jgi:hypothetical protein